QMSVHELNDRKASLQILDVRSPGEWKKGHVPGAQHVFVPELAKRMDGLDRNRPTAVYCGSGYRASIATSILKPFGFTDLWNVPGSWEAWQKAKLPVEGPNSTGMGQQPCHAGRSARRCELMSGGPTRSLYLSGCRFLSFIPRGPLFKGRIIFLAITSRHFIRLKFSETHHTVGSDRSRTGGPRG